MRSLFSTLAILSALLWSGVAFAQASPSAYTTGYRFDALQRLTGLIKPDPDGTGILKFGAERYTYDADGLLVSKEVGELATWQSQSVVPASWAGFTVLQSTYYTYDSVGRKLTERMKGSNGTTYSLTQYSYDDVGRLQCSAVRMNESQFASPPSDVCAPGTPVSANGQDRVTKNFYDAAGQLVQVHQAVGTSIEQAYVTYSFTANGKQEHVIDANGNRAKLEYDGFDRQSKWIFPSNTVPASFNPATPVTALATAGSVNASDYEQYGYDAAGNRTSLRKRDGTTITYQFDALGRISVKGIPDTRPELDSSHTRDVYYSYDLLGLQTAARFDGTSGPGGISVYDGFGRLQSATDSLLSGSPALTYQYDKNGNRTKITHPDNAVFDMVFDGGNRLAQVKKGATVLVAPSYNNRGLVAGADRFNAALDTTLGYDPAGRLTSLTLQYGSNSSNVSWAVSGRNPASQIQAVARNNDAYAWTGRVDANSNYTTNGLNQYTQIGAAGFCYDANGNLTADSEKSYLYDVENRLVEMRERESASACPVGASGYSGALLARLHYDPMGRLYEALAYTSGTLTNTSRFLYDGDAMVLEYDGANAVRNRYVHGNDVGADDPLIWYAGVGSADTDIRNLYGDLRGSIAAVVGQNGSTIAINTYDEWGAPAAANQGRFQYTGQVWLPEIGMYYYKARIYSPRLGRFMQADPVGYEDQVNLYAYVGNDPVNGRDPSGMRNCAPDDNGCVETPESAENPSEPEDNPEDTDKKDEIVVTGQRQRKNISGDKEKFFVVTTTDLERRRLRQRDISCPGGGSVTVGTPGPIPSGASAAHSHPSSHSGVPGPGDNNFGNTSDTGYVITPSRAYAIDRASNGTYRTRILSGGGVSDSEREELVGNMQNWESGNSSDSSKTPQQRFCR